MDEIQKVLIKEGRKDLAQKYYKKTATIAEDDMKAAIKIRKDLESVLTSIQNGYELIENNLSSFNAPGLAVSFFKAIKVFAEDRNLTRAQRVIDEYFKIRGPKIQRENYNEALKEIQLAQVDQKIDLTKFNHKYISDVTFEFEKDDDLGYTWTAHVNGRPIFPTKGNTVIFFKTLDGVKKSFIKNRLTEDSFK